VNNIKASILRVSARHHATADVAVRALFPRHEGRKPRAESRARCPNPGFLPNRTLAMGRHCTRDLRLTPWRGAAGPGPGSLRRGPGARRSPPSAPHLELEAPTGSMTRRQRHSVVAWAMHGPGAGPSGRLLALAVNSGFGRAKVASPDTVTGPLARSLSALQSGTVRVYGLAVKTWYQYSNGWQ
jgi:hypothetical protein